MIEAATRVAFETAGSSQHKELREAADAFESLFTQMLVQQMRDAQLEEGLFGQGSGASTYETIFDQFLSQSLSDRSPLGIADMLYRNWTGEDGPQDSRELTAHLSRLHAAQTYESALGSVSVTTRSVEISFSEKATRSAPRISRPFGFGEDPISGAHRFHGGIDLPAPTGTPVMTPAAGRVTKVEEHPGYGLQVLVDHGDERVTRYAHLSAADVVEGQWLGAGEVLGRVGNSGRSTGPHLHFETHQNGRKIDPTDFIQGPSRAQVLGHAADKPTGTGEDE